MSYVIQNFSYSSIRTKLTIKTRAAFLAKNSISIYTLLTSLSVASSLTTNSYPHLKYLVAKFDYLFFKFSKIIFARPKFLRYLPTGTNFPITAQYQCLQNMNSLLQSKSQLQFFPPVVPSTLYYPYFSITRVVIYPITKSPLLVVLNKLLRMNLHVWFLWPRSCFVASQIIFINSTWLWLKFLNKYFFRVYSL